ncbi:hypothetical protein HK098_004870 [Nowakowskiella sp. JEL0407]|nr:hypothetical protein HK098_004870 [Nowakowskiella sp. JEL0407]
MSTLPIYGALRSLVNSGIQFQILTASGFGDYQFSDVTMQFRLYLPSNIIHFQYREQPGEIYAEIEFDFRTLGDKDFRNTNIKEFFRDVKEDGLGIARAFLGWKSYALYRYFHLELLQEKFSDWILESDPGSESDSGSESATDEEVEDEGHCIFSNKYNAELSALYPSVPFYFLVDERSSTLYRFNTRHKYIEFDIRKYEVLYFPLHPDIAPGFIRLKVSGMSDRIFSGDECDWEFTSYGDKNKFPKISDDENDRAKFEVGVDWFMIFCKRIYPRELRGVNVLFHDFYCQYDLWA